MRKVKYIFIFLLFVNNVISQIRSFDTSYVIASSPNYDYKNPSFNTHDRNDFGTFNDCIVYEKHSDTGSNIIARTFDYFGYQAEIMITNDTNVSNINPSISYTRSIYFNSKSIIVWQSNKNGDWDIYYSIKDTGSTWSAPNLLPMSTQDETNPMVIRKSEWVNSFYLLFERNNEIYIKHFNAATNQWSADSIITLNVPQNCSNPFFFTTTSIRASYLLHDQNSIIKISSSDISFDTITNIFTIGSQIVNQTPKSQLSPSMVKLFKKVYSYGYDTLGSTKIIFCDGNYSNKSIESPDLPGSYSSGIASFHLDITDGNYPYNAFGAVRKNNDSTFIYAGAGYFTIQNDTNFYIGDSNAITRLAITEPIIGPNYYFKIRLVWEQTKNGKTALVESYMIDYATGIHSSGNEISRMFKLHQNYPNPFNPVTKIKFDIPKQGFVSLRVYDITGKEVAVLVNNEEMAPGVYEYSFSAAGELGSGVYFYRLESNGFTETRRMVFVK